MVEKGQGIVCRDSALIEILRQAVHMKFITLKLNVRIYLLKTSSSHWDIASRVLTPTGIVGGRAKHDCREAGGRATSGTVAEGARAEAIKKATKYYSNVDGCAYCAPWCHSG